MDGRVYDVASQLLECVCNKLGDRCPNRKCIVPGLEPSFENCCSGDRGGQLSVTLLQRYPSINFPTVATQVAINCRVPYIVTVYGITVVRCSPVGSNDRPPTCEALQKASEGLMLDSERIWDGVTCCLLDEETMGQLIHGPFTWSIGTLQSITPEGGCAGISVDVAVGMDPCLEC